MGFMGFESETERKERERHARGALVNRSAVEGLYQQQQGTSYQGAGDKTAQVSAIQMRDQPGYNGLSQADYLYGHSYGGADAAVQQAQDLASSAYGTGSNLLGYGMDQASAARARMAPAMQGAMGNWSAQNAALGAAGSYGGALSGLEAEQGPSAAQAQLASGNNAAMAQQLALARSGRGFGGNAAAMGQAQGNMAQLGAANANQAAMLRAQEDAAWRQRQAANLQSAANVSLARGQQLYGQQQADVGAQMAAQQANLNAQLASTAQNDQASLGWAGYGANAYGQGVGAGLQSQQLQNQIRGQQMTGDMGYSDALLRRWAAQNGLTLGQQQRQDQQNAALLQTAATVGAMLI